MSRHHRLRHPQAGPFRPSSTATAAPQLLRRLRQPFTSYTEPGHMAKVFCGRCGSSLFGGTWPDGPEVSIRLGTLDDDPEIRPSHHSFAGETPAWDAIADDGLPRYPHRPPRTVV